MPMPHVTTTFRLSDWHQNGVLKTVSRVARKDGETRLKRESCTSYGVEWGPFILGMTAVQVSKYRVRKLNNTLNLSLNLSRLAPSAKTVRDVNANLKP